MALRIGMGYDSHRFAKNRPLILGGVKIRHHQGLLGHSDADVLLHAIVDALLGAAGLPDIGHYFSNKDPRWKNASSFVFLKEVKRIFKKKKIKIMNIDSVLISEAPKIAPYIQTMKSKLAVALGLKTTQIGIKASTNEGMGFVGRQEGMASSAVALVKIG